MSPVPAMDHEVKPGTRRAAVLAHLTDHPDLTAGELARALGASSRLNHLLRNMEAKAQVVRTTVWWPQQGRPDLFFPSDEESGAKAKAICRRCPIRRQCYELARARREPWGIWGGVDFAPAARGRKAS